MKVEEGRVYRDPDFDTERGFLGFDPEHDPSTFVRDSTPVPLSLLEIFVEDTRSRNGESQPFPFLNRHFQGLRLKHQLVTKWTSRDYTLDPVTRTDVLILTVRTFCQGDVRKRERLFNLYRKVGLVCGLGWWGSFF